MRVFLSRLTVCVAFFSFALYSYLKEQNRCTEMRMLIPKLVKEIEAIEEQNSRLRYQVVTFESPQQLLTLSKQPEFSHLHFPFVHTIIQAREGLALQLSQEEEAPASKKGRSPALAVAK